LNNATYLHHLNDLTTHSTTCCPTKWRCCNRRAQLWRHFTPCIPRYAL